MLGASVFFAPTNLRAGGYWAAALAKAIDERTPSCCSSVNKIGPWQALGILCGTRQARELSQSFPVLLMLLEGKPAPGLPFLRQLHWIVTADPASERDVARLLDAATGDASHPDELWRFTSPYRGLAAMEEKDSDYFFGRESETVEVLKALAAAPDQLPVLLGNSGVGKSSLAQAGALAALAGARHGRSARAQPARGRQPSRRAADGASSR